MGTTYLGRLTSISVNASAYMPPTSAIWKRYTTKFHASKQAEEEDETDMGFAVEDL